MGTPIGVNEIYEQMKVNYFEIYYFVLDHFDGKTCPAQLPPLLLIITKLICVCRKLEQEFLPLKDSEKRISPKF